MVSITVHYLVYLYYGNKHKNKLKVYSEVTIKGLEKSHLGCSDVFYFNFY